LGKRLGEERGYREGGYVIREVIGKEVEERLWGGFRILRFTTFQISSSETSITSCSYQTS